MLGAVGGLLFTLVWVVLPRSQDVSCGEAECHVPVPAMVGAVAAAIAGVWLIVERREGPGSMVAFIGVVAAWAFFALVWPLGFGYSCDLSC